MRVFSKQGATVGGWKLQQRIAESQKTEVTFRRVTFRRGEVRGARFTPDGDTIVYSAAWAGRPSEIYVASRQSPEARPLGIPDAELLAVAKSSELAVLLRRDRLTGLGTLARVPIGGGTCVGSTVTLYISRTESAVRATPSGFDVYESETACRMRLNEGIPCRSSLGKYVPP